MEPNQQPSSTPPPALSPPPTPRRRSKRPFVILGTIAASTVAIYLLYGWYTKNRESTDNAQVEADVVPVSARVGGTVLAIHVMDNQHVHKGDPILELDPADLSARVAQATADLEAADAQAAAADAQQQIVSASAKGGLSTAQAQLSGSATSVRSADAQIAAARATLARARADLKKADLDLDRATKLHAQGAASDLELQNAQTSHDVTSAAAAQAQAQLEAAIDGRNAAQSKVAEMQGRVDQSAPVEPQIKAATAAADLAHARVKAASAALAIAKLQLDYAKVTAPADGVISRLGVREGQQLSAGQVIVELVPATTYVVANFKETQVARMAPGQRAEIAIDALPGRTFEGRIESVSAATGARFSMLPPDNASGNFVKVVQRVPVKIAWVDAPPRDVQAGLSADVTVFVK